MGPHKVACHPTYVNLPRVNPSQTYRNSTYLPWKNGRLGWLGYIPRGENTEMVFLSADSQTVTRPSSFHCGSRVQLTRYVDPLPVCYQLTKPPSNLANDGLAGRCRHSGLQYHWRRQLWGTGARAPPSTFS